MSSSEWSSSGVDGWREWMVEWMDEWMVSGE